MVKVLRKLREVAEQNTRKIPECFFEGIVSYSYSKNNGTAARRHRNVK